MRFDVQLLDHISDEFFTAALNPSQWPSVIEKVSAASGSYGVNIVPIAGRLLGSIIETESLKPAMECYFGDEWHERDFRVLQVPLLKRVGVILEQDYASAEQFDTLDYYRAQVEFGLRWTAMVGFSSGEDLLAFVLHRQIHEGPFDREEAVILQHIRQKLMISAAMMRDISASTVSGMSAAFEIANVACIFFDRLGMVTTINEKAKALLGADLQITKGELRPACGEDAAAFNRRLKSVLGPNVSFEADEDGVLLLTRVGKRPLIARIQRVCGDVQDIFSHSCAVAVIEDPEERVQQRPGTLNKLFGLTRAEAEIAQLLAQGMSLHEIAASRSISYETARAHLKAIYRKTETNRQSELSLLLAKIRMS
ncbi:helix-turn-helix transcriptional regulator [Rhizobium tubonense]|uniref:LuxR family transcriptional regulator n=1 Tax=Rhizobium tubonense TaxID=484088 RepID=A0A2W4EJ14_9HYPH|nr:helix-turn-helix transcriptional regulator [Rhizobium tubonense]PZM13966.1 LuxR family transcriptional regulator [Rhizobium tubonense]